MKYWSVKYSNLILVNHLANKHNSMNIALMNIKN